jgi:DNA repair and recombination protein RAD54B
MSHKWKMFKPFKPPLLKSIARSEDPISIPDSDSDQESRPAKKRKLLIVEEKSLPTKAPSSSAALAPRKPLLVVKNLIETNKSADVQCEGPEGYYLILWHVKSDSASLDSN